MPEQSPCRRLAREMRKRFAPLVCLFAAIGLSVLLLWPEDCLAAENGGALLFALPIRKGERFEVSFTHSLNLSPVTDVIEWTGSEMILRKSIFKTFGAGIPVPSDGVGGELIHLDGRYELLGIDKPMKDFSIMTETVPNHRISVKGREIALLRLVEAGKSVKLSVKRVPRLAQAFVNRRVAYVFLQQAA